MTKVKLIIALASGLLFCGKELSEGLEVELKAGQKLRLYVER